MPTCSLNTLSLAWQGLRMRRRGAHHWQRAFGMCDVIVTPTTACTAPDIPAGAEVSGALHLPTTAKLVRFTTAANLLGLPALAIPVGGQMAACPGGNLPVSLQLIGRPWCEATILRAGHALEQALRARNSGAPAAAMRLNPLAAAAAAGPNCGV